MLEFLIESREDDDVTGRLTIGGPSPITVESAFLDSWLDALLDGFVTVMKGSATAEVDLIEEPSPLIVERHSNEISICWAGHSVHLGDIDHAAAELVRDVRKILAQIPLHNTELQRRIEERAHILERELRPTFE